MVRGVDNILAFIEKRTSKQPIQQQMDADSGLVRKGTVMGAINEWQTWFVLTRQ